MNILIVFTLIGIASGQQYGLPSVDERLPLLHGLTPTSHSYAPYPAPQFNIQNYELPDRKGIELLGPHKPLLLPENARIDIRDKSGQYSHGFNSGGTQFSEQGSLITTNGGWEYVIAKKGSYSYTSPEGKKITVHYIADHNGYRTVDSPDSV